MAYMDHVTEPDKIISTVDRIKREVLDLCTEFNVSAIAIRGISGAIIGFPLCYLLCLPPIVVRKEPSHSFGLIEFPMIFREENIQQRPMNYMVIDDFISTGATVNETIREIKNSYPNWNLRFIYLYGSGFRNKEFSYSTFNAANGNTYPVYHQITK